MPKRTRAFSHLLIVSLACAFILLTRGSNLSLTVHEAVTQIPGPTLKWKTELDEQFDTYLALSDGIIYVTNSDHFYALDAATGKLKWKKELPSYGLSAPIVANGLVYVGGHYSLEPGMDTRMSSVNAYALDARTGTIKWQHELAHDRSEDASNAVLANGLVYFGTGWGDWSCCEDRGNGGRIVALNALTGDLVWQIDTQNAYGSGGMPRNSFGIANGILYLGTGFDGPYTTERQLRALDAKTGNEIWKLPFDDPFPSITTDSAVYLRLASNWRDTELLSLDGKSGQERWRWKNDPDKQLLSKPTIAGDTTYIAQLEKRDICSEGPCAPATAHADTLFALDSATGREQWVTEIDGGYYGVKDLTLFGPYICFNTEDRLVDPPRKYIQGVDIRERKLRWRLEIDGSVFGPPTTIDNVMYLGTSHGTIYALQLP